MASNPSLPASSLPPSSPLSAQTTRLPLAVDCARAVVVSTLALLRGIQRDSGSAISTTDGRYVSTVSSLRALHLEIEDQWFTAQLDTGTTPAAATAVKGNAERTSRARGSRKMSSSALGSSPLERTDNLDDAPSGAYSDSGQPRSSLLAIAGLGARQPVSSTAETARGIEPLGADDIPEMPVMSRLGLPTREKGIAGS